MWQISQAGPAAEVSGVCGVDFKLQFLIQSGWLPRVHCSALGSLVETCALATVTSNCPTPPDAANKISLDSIH